MEKVKISEERLNGITKDKIVYGNRAIIQESLKGGVYEDIGPEKMALILCDWFEVEPEYKVGDFVANKTTLEIYGVVSVNENNLTLQRDEFKGISSFSEIRHATPEEIKQEKERRTDRKLNELLSTLSNEELSRLREKLKCGLDVNTNE